MGSDDKSRHQGLVPLGAQVPNTRYSGDMQCTCSPVVGCAARMRRVVNGHVDTWPAGGAVETSDQWLCVSMALLQHDIPRTAQPSCRCTPMAQWQLLQAAQPQLCVTIPLLGIVMYSCSHSDGWHTLDPSAALPYCSEYCCLLAGCELLGRECQ